VGGRDIKVRAGEVKSKSQITGGMRPKLERRLTDNPNGPLEDQRPQGENQKKNPQRRWGHVNVEVMFRSQTGEVPCSTGNQFKRTNVTARNVKEKPGGIRGMAETARVLQRRPLGDGYSVLDEGSGAKM